MTTRPAPGSASALVEEAERLLELIRQDVNAASTLLEEMRSILAQSAA